VNAGRIVDAFGAATFDVIDTHPGRLTEVAGIGPIRAARIAATWAEQRQIREVMTALQSYGVSTSLAVRIYQRFGNDSARIVAQEPYRLAREVWGIGFKTADKIARAVGIAEDAPARLEAGVLHALGVAAEEGHTLLPQQELLGQAVALLAVAPEGVAAATTALLGTGELVQAEQAGQPDPLLALAPFARAESGLASRLAGLAGRAGRTRSFGLFGAVDWQAAFGWLGERHGLHLASEQEAAVHLALTAPLALLPGGPGTGKTHTLRALLLLARAKRMEEATGLPAGTLHRLLELRPGGHDGSQLVRQRDMVW
jgi:exodeoxyribonuclease V alpha subunit